jgi:hypothetical protein
MAGLKNISHSPADRRGLGLTFLGMMQEGNNQPASNNLAIAEIYAEIRELRDELAELRSYVRLSWYKKLWRKYGNHIGNSKIFSD